MKNIPQILLIYTGGTIGMVKDFKDGTLKAFDFSNIEKQIPELKLLACNTTCISFKEPIDSSNVTPEHWLELAAMIEENYDQYDGFVILHGSDTMSYTASAMSFLIENLDKPIVFTGSQLPIGDLRTDAKENLITAIQIASLHNDQGPILKEVGLYFEYKLYRANRTTKINADHFNAFASLNYPPLAESGVHLEIQEEYLLKPTTKKAVQFHKSLDTAVMVVKLFPGIQEVFLQSILKTPGLKGIVLETFGSGNAPTAAWFHEWVDKALKSGMYIVNVTQCSGGGVLSGYYETSLEHQHPHVINGKDITTESAITKLMFLLGVNTPKESFKFNFENDLRGEMSSQ